MHMLLLFPENIKRCFFQIAYVCIRITANFLSYGFPEIQVWCLDLLFIHLNIKLLTTERAFSSETNKLEVIFIELWSKPRFERKQSSYFPLGGLCTFMQRHKNNLPFNKLM